MSQLSNYNSFEGVLYCRPHFDQNFKRTGSLEKSFEGKLPKTDQNVKSFVSGDFKFGIIYLKFDSYICTGTPKIGKPDRPLEGEVLSDSRTKPFFCF
jgi:hypothetical protein